MRIKRPLLATAALAVVCLAQLVNLAESQYAVDDRNEEYCSNDDFICSDGTCIPFIRKCDQRTDCLNGEDELDCDEKCDVPEDKICDRIRDCPDGSDEDPDVCGCDASEFQCKDNECIKADKKCNGFFDCLDESDEEDCDPNEITSDICKGKTFQCDNKLCVNIDFRCDGNEDCTDGSDERNCNDFECTEGQWRCKSGECIPTNLKCDSYYDCKDGSDETDCPLATSEPPITAAWPPYTQNPRPAYPEYTPATQAPSTPRPDFWDPATRPHWNYPTTGRTPLDSTESSLLDLRIEDNSQEVKEEGEDVVFRCRDYSFQRARVTWVRERNMPLQPRYVDNGRGRLELFNVTRADAGAYICRSVGQASQDETTTKTVYLTVIPRKFTPQQGKHPECEHHETSCNDGKCIPKSAICDGRLDCVDGSDEMACGAVCEPNQFHCANGRCVLITWRCDSVDDCYDNSDEMGCPSNRPDECASTEFRCQSGQCIGKSMQCDGSNDCYDTSDEVGCEAQIYIPEPPPRSKFLARGESMVIKCRAVGNPPPVIVWRLNWGHIPKKCSYTNDVSPNGKGATVIGTLTCPDVQYEDQGAYSCEAINNKGTLFAVPDTILTVNGSSIGETCPAGYFNSLAQSEQDCISCFCFGVTTRCKSADLYTYQIPTPLGEGGTVLLGLSQTPKGELAEQSINDFYDYQSRFRNEATVTRLVTSTDSASSNVHPYLALPETYNEMQLTSYGGFIKYTLRPHNRKYQFSNMPDIVIQGKHLTLVYHAPEETFKTPEVNLEVRLLPQYWSKISPYGIKQASREDIMMALDNVERIMLRADVNGAGVNITNFKMDSAQRENFGLGVANLVEECECPQGYGGLSCHKCKDGYERIASGPWLGLCNRVDEVCPPGTYGEPRRGVPCSPCPCPLTAPSNRFAGTCHLASDGQVSCNCNPGYEGRRCETCAPGLVGNPLELGDSCRQPVRSHCNIYGTEREIDGRCKCKQKVEGTYCDQCTRDSFLLSPDNLYGCAECFCMGMTDQCSSSNLRRTTVTSKFNNLEDSTTVYVVQGASTKYKDPKPANVLPELIRGELVLRSLDHSGYKTYYWSVPNSLTGDKVTSYGGFLTYSLKHWPAATPQNLLNAPSAITIFSKNLITIHNYGNVSMSSTGHLNGSVQLIESNWRRSDGKLLLRSDFLIALADVDKILIRATYTRYTQQAWFVSASIDIAESHGSGPRAVHVEECRCPRNYTGTSCEACAPGYTRSREGIYLAYCEECDCNGHSTQCDAKTGVCSNCLHNRAGDHCEECLPGFRDNGRYCEEDFGERPPEIGSECNCDQRGEAGPCYSNGQCNCKKNVEGQSCSVCRPGTFDLNLRNPDGCLSCYCSGASRDCQSSNYNRIPMPVYALTEQHGFTLQTIEADHIINDNIILDQEKSQLGYIFGTYPPPDNYYWSLPMLPGNRVTSYGGNLLITQKFESGNYEEMSQPTMNVVLTSDHLSLFWNNPITVRSGDLLKYQVMLRENHWRDLANNGEITRDQFLSVLATLRRVLVLASLSPGVTSTYIADISMDVGVPDNSGNGGTATDIELCRCPPGYKGTSCEQCMQGFYNMFGRCVECPCNGNADSCQLDANNVVVCNCRFPYNGRNCAGVDSASSVTTTRRPPTETTVTVQITKPLIKIYALGSTVNYTCTARSRVTNTPLTVTWKKSAGNLPLNRAYTDDRTGSLVIQNVQVSDSGTYVCEANDGVSLSQEYVALTVSPNSNVPPVAKIVPAYRSAYEGDLIQLECRTSGVPKPSISWDRVGQALPYGIQMNGAVFTIDSARISDSGEYRCLAQSASGSAEALAVINVARKQGRETVQLTISPNRPNIQEGLSTKIICKSSSSDVPSDSLYWSRNSRENLPSNFRVDSGTLYISSPVPDNNDVYVCQSSSKEFIITPVQVAVNVHPLEPIPINPDDKPSISLEVNATTIPTGGNAFIQCIPKGFPLPIVTWKKYQGDFSASVSQRGNALVISQAEDIDDGYYICEANLPDGTRLNPSYLIVYIEKREKPEVEIWPTGLQTVQLGSTFEIYCRVTKGLPLPVVTWSRSSDRALSNQTNILPGNILKFREISVNDEGEYVCTASNVAGSASAATSLSVQSRPRLTIIPDNYVRAKLGQPMKVVCRASGYPEPVVYWRKENAVPQDLGAPATGIASLIFERVADSDEGTYTCIAQSAAGKIQDQISFAINYDDEFKNPEPNYDTAANGNVEPSEISLYTPVGTNFRMNCQLKSLDSDVEIIWKRTDGYSLDPNVVRGNSLVWDKISKQDEGTYQCSVVDRYTRTPRVAAQKRLFVERPPKITVKPPFQTVKPQDSAVVECVVEGDKPMQVIWQSESGYFSPRVQVDKTKLKFNRIEVEDAGTYICFARNRVANATGTAEVKVTDTSTNSNYTEPPKSNDRVVIEKPQRPIPAGSDVVVACRASSNTIAVSWQKPVEGGPIQFVNAKNGAGISILDIPNVQSSDSGVYRCIGKNRHTQVFDEFDLQVEPAKPTPSYPPEEKLVEADLGSTVQLVCTDNGERLSKVEWKHAYGPPLNITESVLVLHNISEADSGTYICRWMTENHAIVTQTILKVNRVVPMFSADSWLALPPMPASDIFSDLAFEISVKPMANDGIILYNSENNSSYNDFIALRLINGEPEFQFNPGTAVASLRGDRPLELNKWHTIRIMRNFNKLSMTVDNNSPYTTTYTGNSYQGLELKEPIYIGGVPDYWKLPVSLSDVPPSGLVGCVSMLILNSEEKSLMREKIDDSGNLAECNTCTPSMCRNDGVCQEAQNERGYSCLCKAGFAGQDCNRTGEACRQGLCGPGKCTDTVYSYKCTCPPTHNGKNCEHRQTLVYPAFTGSGYLAFDPFKGVRTLRLTMKIKPISPVTDGILMYCAESHSGNGGFTSLAVKDSYLEFRYDLGNANVSTVLRSQKPLKADDWTEVTIKRVSTHLQMTTNNLYTVKADLPRDVKQVRWHTPLYIGGYDEKVVTLNPRTQVTGGFNGCIKDVIDYPDKLNITNAKGANVRECRTSGSERGDIPYLELSTSANDIPQTECQCRNNGRCRDDSSCICPAGYYGAICEHRQPSQSSRQSCYQGLCQSGGTCRDASYGYSCDCPLGYTGANCQTRSSLQKNANFEGKGYLVLRPEHLDYYSGEQQTIGIRIRTDRDGLILFQHSARDPPGYGKYLLLAVDNGMATLRFDFGSGNMTLQNQARISDNKPHLIIVYLKDDKANLEVDRDSVYANTGVSLTEFNEPSDIYIGGVPPSFSLREQGLVGCIQQIEFTSDTGALHLGNNAIDGVNVGRCPG